MNRKNVNDIEDQIMGTIKNAINAIDAIDLSNIKKDFANKAENTFKGVKDSFDSYNSMMKKSCKQMNIKYENSINDVKSKINQYNQEIQKERNQNRSNPQGEGTQSNIYLYIAKRPAGSISGVIWILLGTIAAVVTAIMLLVCILGLAILDFSFIGISIFFLIIFAISMAVVFKGISIRKRVERFKSYVRIIGNDKYCLISDLAKFTKETPSFVIKELNKMISLDMFKQAHIDDEKTYFMISDDVYRNYLDLKKQQILKEREEKSNLNKNEQDIKEEINSVVKVGKKHIEEITNIRSTLYNGDITVKLDKLIDISNQILNYVNKNPNKIQEINKFINHYLPITIKLVASYKELDNQVVKGDNIVKAKLEIERSIDVINVAFENLLDDLFEDVALDVSTDISVLKTLFKQEGLTEEDFEK